MNLRERMDKLEEIVTNHLKESGAIQENLKWNTRITGAILAAIIAQAVYVLVHK